MKKRFVGTSFFPWWMALVLARSVKKKPCKSLTYRALKMARPRGVEPLTS